MSVPRVVLLTGIPPGEGSVGELFLKDLCLAYPHDSLFCFTPTVPGFGKRSEDLAWLRSEKMDWPYDYPFRPIAGPLGGSISLLSTQYARRIRRTKLKAQAAMFARENKIDMVWAVLYTPTVYHLATSLADELSLP